MIITCPNCEGMLYVYNSFRQRIACPTCGNRGMVNRVEQVNIYGSYDVILEQLQPDQKVKYTRGSSHVDQDTKGGDMGDRVLCLFPDR